MMVEEYDLQIVGALTKPTPPDNDYLQYTWLGELDNPEIHSCQNGLSMGRDSKGDYQVEIPLLLTDELGNVSGHGTTEVPRHHSICKQEDPSSTTIEWEMIDQPAYPPPLFTSHAQANGHGHDHTEATQFQFSSGPFRNASNPDVSLLPDNSITPEEFYKETFPSSYSLLPLTNEDEKTDNRVPEPQIENISDNGRTPNSPPKGPCRKKSPGTKKQPKAKKSADAHPIKIEHLMQIEDNLHPPLSTRQDDSDDIPNYTDTPQLTCIPFKNTISLPVFMNALGYLIPRPLPTISTEPQSRDSNLLLMRCLQRVLATRSPESNALYRMKALFNFKMVQKLNLDPRMFLPTNRVARQKSANGRGLAKRPTASSRSSPSAKSSTSPNRSQISNSPQESAASFTESKYVSGSRPWKSSIGYPLGFIPMSAWQNMQDLPERHQFSTLTADTVRAIPEGIVSDFGENGLGGYKKLETRPRNRETTSTSPGAHRASSGVSSGTSNGPACGAVFGCANEVALRDDYTYEEFERERFSETDLYSALIQRNRPNFDGRVIAERLCGMCKKFFGRDNSQYVQHMKQHHGISASTRDYYVIPWLLAAKPLLPKARTLHESNSYIAFCDHCQTWVQATRNISERDYRGHALYSPWFTHMSSHLGDDNIADGKANEKSAVSEVHTNRTRYRQRADNRRANTLRAIRDLLADYHRISDCFKDRTQHLSISSIMMRQSNFQ